MNDGQSGERYILGSQNLTLGQILSELAVITGRKPPRDRIPYSSRDAAGVVTTAWATSPVVAPRVPLDAVRMARKKMFVSHEKAARELQYSPRTGGEALC